MEEILIACHILSIMKKTRLLLITHLFDPEPTFKGLVFARELVNQGFDVEVLTGFPNYPGGVLYPGYKIQPFHKSQVDGIQITRVPLYPSHDQSALRRFFSYFSFALSAAIYGAFLAQRPDVIYAYHPPLTTGISALFIKLLRRAPIVYDIQDMWPDSLRATGMLTNSFLLSIVSLFCRATYSLVDHIVVLSPGFKRLLVARNVPASKISVIFNWADENSLDVTHSDSALNLPGNHHFRIMFAGNIGKAQALDTIIESAAILQELGSNIIWILLGCGIEMDRLKTEVVNRKLTNVVFLPSVPMGEVGFYLKSADALLVHLRKDPLFEITIPSKTQAYMTVGKPLLMAVDGDAADLVRQSGCGLVAESENPDALVRAALQLADMSPESLSLMGKRAQLYYSDHLSIVNGVTNFSAIFRSLCHSL